MIINLIKKIKEWDESLAEQINKELEAYKASEKEDQADEFLYIFIICLLYFFLFQLV